MKAGNHVLASSAETRRGQPGVNPRSTWDQTRVNLWSTCSALPGRWRGRSRTCARHPYIGARHMTLATTLDGNTESLPRHVRRELNSIPKGTSDMLATRSRLSSTMLFAHGVPAYPHTLAEPVRCMRGENSWVVASILRSSSGDQF